jgi:hypothetical protein
MKCTSTAHAEEQLTQLAAQFDHWRSVRTSRAERIPSPLWQQAVALTTVLSFSRVAKCLRVSWSDLRKHCAAAQTTAARVSPPPSLHFVEIPPVPPWSLPVPEATIELSRADGASLRIHARAPQLPLVAVIRTFLEPPTCSN